MPTKADLMMTLCSAFGVFSAFGAAILAFFTAGGGLQRITSLLASREQVKAAAQGATPHKRAALGGAVVVWLVASVVAFAVLISGIGLFTSFFWLRAGAAGSGPASKWAYNLAVDMFYIDAVVITVITLAAVTAAAMAVLPNSAGGGTANKQTWRSSRRRASPPPKVTPSGG
jgi:hypothetical protein